MPILKVKARSDGQQVLEWARPQKAPILVQVLKVLLGLGLILSLYATGAKVFTVWDINTRIDEQESRLYQMSEFEMDDTIDGRWRYCREHEDECMPPWGDNSDGMNLFTANGWDGISGPAVRYQRAVGRDSSGNAVDPDLDLEDACDDDPSFCDASYPLYGDYSTGMPMFVGREMLKLLRVTLNLVVWVGFLLAFYIIFNYGLMLFQLTRGHPGVLSKVFRIGFIQAAMEFLLWMYVSSAADTVYSLPFKYSFKLVFFVALAIMFLSQLPPVKRYCSRFRLEYKGKEGGPEATSASGAGGAVPSGAVPSGAVPSSAVPSSAVPSSAVPSSAVPSSAVPSSAVPSSAAPSGAVPSGAVPGANPGVGIAPAGAPGEGAPGGVASGGVAPLGVAPGAGTPGSGGAGAETPHGSTPTGDAPEAAASASTPTPPGDPQGQGGPPS